MNIALALSAVASCLCLVLLAVPRRRRRSVGAKAETTGSEGQVNEAVERPLTRQQIQSLRRAHGDKVPTQDRDSQGSVDLALPAPVPPPEPPVLISPITPSIRRPSWIVIVLAALFAGGLAAAVSTALCALVVGTSVALCLAVRHLRALPGLVAIGFFVAAVVNVIRLQSVEHFGPGDWPSHFTSAGALMWVAIVLVGADGVVGALGDTPPQAQGDARDTEAQGPSVEATSTDESLPEDNTDN